MYLEFDFISSVSWWVTTVHQENSLKFAKSPNPALGSLCLLAFSQLLCDHRMGLITTLRVAQLLLSPSEKCSAVKQNLCLHFLFHINSFI